MIPFGTNTSVDWYYHTCKRQEENKNQEGWRQYRCRSGNHDPSAQWFPMKTSDKTIDALCMHLPIVMSISPNSCVIVDDKPRFLECEWNPQVQYRTNTCSLKGTSEIRKSGVREWHFSSYWWKFSLKREIYRNIEECTTWESVIETIDLDLKPYKKRREIAAMTFNRAGQKLKPSVFKIRCKRTRMKISGLEDQLKEVNITWRISVKTVCDQLVQRALRKYSKGRKGKREKSLFEQEVVFEG